MSDSPRCHAAVARDGRPRGPRGIRRCPASARASSCSCQASCGVTRGVSGAARRQRSPRPGSPCASTSPGTYSAVSCATSPTDASQVAIAQTCAPRRRSREGGMGRLRCGTRRARGGEGTVRSSELNATATASATPIAKAMSTSTEWNASRRRLAPRRGSRRAYCGAPPWANRSPERAEVKGGAARTARSTAPRRRRGARFRSRAARTTGARPGHVDHVGAEHDARSVPRRRAGRRNQLAPHPDPLPRRGEGDGPNSTATSTATVLTSALPPAPAAAPPCVAWARRLSARARPPFRRGG